MVEKEKLLEIANKRSWDYFGGVDRCSYCGKYRFTGDHEEDCPLGALLKLIEEKYGDEND